MGSFGHNYQHLKIMQFSVKEKQYLAFPTNGRALCHPVCDLHLNLSREAIAITAAY